MIKENLIAERIACEHYEELVRYFGDKDPATRVMMEKILLNEEEHANDMLDLLKDNEGKPSINGNGIRKKAAVNGTKRKSEWR